MKDVHETERFAPIDGFPDYLITSHGRVFSLKYSKLKEIKQGKNVHGYMHVVLCKNGKMITKTIHRLVAQTFIPNPENKPQVNHIDEDKTNNHVSNLEWVTCKENINHGTHNERISKYRQGKKHTDETKRKMSLNHADYKGSNHPHSKSVIGFKINGCDIKYYKYMSECRKDGFIQSCIVNTCRKKYKSHKGYVWYYTDEFFNKKE